jgi:hydrogenase nickel incorporation protein HypA/HybF
MHEVSIANAIVQIIQEALPDDKAGYISAVHIRVGQLSAIETDALLFAFDIVKSKTPLSRAALHIEIIEGKGECSDCGTVFPMTNYATPCPNCNSYLIKIIQGKDMKVVSFDMENEEL